MTAANETEDDFLDDLLDEFKVPSSHGVADEQSGKSSSKSDKILSSDNELADMKNDVEAPALDTDFERQLQLGMEQLLAGFAQTEEGCNDNKDQTHVESVKETMEALMKSLGSEVDGKCKPNARNMPSSKEFPDFQSAINDTMSQLKESKDKVETELNDPNFEHPPAEEMEQLMKQLEDMMGSGEFEDMFGSVMGQLVSRDLLYEPMKDLAAKYPEYLAENQSTLSTADYARFTAQHEIIVKIMEIYDNSNIAGDEEQKKVGDLMQKMQEHGNPPEGLLEKMAPGMQFGADGAPKFAPGMPGIEGNPDCCIM